MRHRGPDETGVYEGPGVVLGHDRLSIIDLSTGRQPLSNETGDVWIAFNGEIYNFVALRTWLLGLGHRFRTTTDTEVLVHLYEEMGPSMVERLDGMFAFALWQGGRLMLARDPLGIKPLYYLWDGGAPGRGTLYFASELRAMTRLAPDSLGFGVHEFPNGHYWVSDGGFCRYFHLDRAEGAPETGPERAARTIQAKLKAAVKKRLVADVPVGVFLSGGLDSSLIAAMAREELSGELHSFAVGMKGSKDLAFSRLVADHLGTVHHTYEYGPEEIIEVLPEVIRHLESYDPALVRSAVPTFLVSRLAARHVKVVLAGEGADELFAGYAYLKESVLADLNRELAIITGGLHNTNLQRVDRMSMAHSIEARVPFLDRDLVEYAFRLSADLKLAPGDHVEKWVLRKVAERYLPREVAWRKKEKFAHGTGTSDVLAAWASRTFAARKAAAGSRLGGSEVPGSAEEVLYREIFLRFLPEEVADTLVGRTRSVVAGEIA